MGELHVAAAGPGFKLSLIDERVNDDQEFIVAVCPPWPELRSDVLEGDRVAPIARFFRAHADRREEHHLLLGKRHAVTVRGSRATWFRGDVRHSRATVDPDRGRF